MNAPKLSWSALLVIFSVFITIVSWIVPDIGIYAMSRFFYLRGDFGGIVAQMALYQFLHGGILHIFSNAIFLLYFGTRLEMRIGFLHYVLFFLTNTVFVGVFLIAFSNDYTIGISGFCMAILTYIALDLRSINHPDYKGAFLLILLNVAIGLDPSVSLLGHLAGAIFGAIWWGIEKGTDRILKHS